MRIVGNGTFLTTWVGTILLLSSPALACSPGSEGSRPVGASESLDLGIHGGDCQRFAVTADQPVWVTVREHDSDLTLYLPGQETPIAYNSRVDDNWLEAVLIDPSSLPTEFAVGAAGTLAVTARYQLVLRPVGGEQFENRLVRRALDLTMKAVAGDAAPSDAPSRVSHRAAAFAAAAEAWSAAGQPVESAWMRLAQSRVYRDASDYKTALVIAREALGQLDPETYPTESLRLAMERGALLLFAERLDESEAVLRQAINRGQGLDAPSLLAELYIFVGLVNHTRDQLALAESDYLKAEALLTRDPVPRLNSMVHNNLAGIHFMRGEPAPAFREFDLAIDVAAASGDGQGQAHALMNAATLHVDLGQYDRALIRYSDALDLFQQLEAEGDVALALRGIGSVYLNLGDPARARDFLLAAIAKAQSASDKLTVNGSRLSLGKAYRMMGDLQAAREQHQLLLEDSQAADRKADVARARVQLAMDDIEAGDLPSARERLGTAIDEFRALGYRHSLVNAVYEMGVTQAGLGDIADARQWLTEADRLQSELGDDTARVLTLTMLSRLDAMEGDLDAALALAYQAAELSDAVRGQVSNADLRASLFSTRLEPYDEIVRLHYMLGEKGEPTTHAIAALNAVERARARSVKDLLLRDNSWSEVADQGAEQRQLVEKINGQLMRLRMLNRDLDRLSGTAGLAGENAPARRQTLEKEIDEVESQLRALRLELDALDARTLHRSLSARDAATATDFSQLPSRLPEGVVVLVFHFTEDESYAWAISGAGVQPHRLAPAWEIRDAVNRAVDLASHWQPEADDLDTALAVVSRQLLSPLAGRTDVKRVIIVPDGPAQLAPFAALTLPGGEPLLAQAVISFASSPGVLIDGEGGRPRSDYDTVAVFADPVFDAGTLMASVNRGAAQASGIGAILGHLGPLPYSEAEAEAIRRLAGARRVDVFTGRAAAKSELFSMGLEQYSLIHFATHAVSAPDFPEYSGVVLSQVDTSGSEVPGLMHLQEIYSLPIDADLVVLSACSTAAGRNLRGEGPMSLGRAFMYAGARQVLMTRWEIPDDVTAELMERFYDGLFEKGLSPAEALRNAQLEISKVPAWRHPFYWAGYLLGSELGS